MKQNFINNNDLEKVSENPIVYIKVFFEDDYLGYGSFDMIAEVEMLKKMVKTCVDAMAIDNDFEHKVYDEISNIRFRPKVNVEEFCLSIVRYICTMKMVQGNTEKFFSPYNRIVVHINIDNDEWSSIGSFEPQERVNFYKDTDNLHYVGKSEVKIAFESKIEFLSMTDKVFFIGMFNLLKSSGVQSFDLVDGKLFHWWFSENNENEDLHQNDMTGILERLLFNDFIDFQHESEGDKNYRREITICDMDIVTEYLNKKNEHS